MFASTRIRTTLIGAVTCITALAAVLLMKGQGRPMPVDKEAAAAAVGTDDLVAAARTRVFFQHQSVGMNVLDGIPDVYAAHDLPAPRVVELATTAEPVAGSTPGGDGFVAHAFFGQNGDPFAKVTAFDERIRAGLGRDVDVAFMKFCYVDITRDTDVEALFERYRSTMAALERDFPAVTFLHVTTPLTTEPSVRTRIKALLGRDDHLGPADNAARERLNTLMRREYDGPRLFDLAAVESTAPDGSRVEGSYQGRPYRAMWAGYAADAGHLNSGGAATAAAQLLRLVGQVSEAGR